MRLLPVLALGVVLLGSSALAAECARCFDVDVARTAVKHATGQTAMRGYTTTANATVDLDTGTVRVTQQDVHRSGGESRVTVTARVSERYPFTLDGTFEGTDHVVLGSDQSWDAAYHGTFRAEGYSVGYSSSATYYSLQDQETWHPGGVSDLDNAMFTHDRTPVSVVWIGNGTLTYDDYRYTTSSDRLAGQAEPGVPTEARVVVRLSGSAWFGGPELPLRATITSVHGEAEIVFKDGSAVPASVGRRLLEGDRLSTGFDGRVTLEFDHGSLRVGSLTTLGIDEFVRKENVAKTQLFLEAGQVAARTKHVPSIRSDFAVRTPTATSAVRGSAMVVSYDNTTATTTVLVTEDEAVVNGSGGEPATIGEGQRVRITEGAGPTAPEAFALEDVPEEMRFPAPAPHAPAEKTPKTPAAGGMAAAAALAAVAAGLRRRV